MLRLLARKKAMRWLAVRFCHFFHIKFLESRTMINNKEKLCVECAVWIVSKSNKNLLKSFWHEIQLCMNSCWLHKIASVEVILLRFCIEYSEKLNKNLESIKYQWSNKLADQLSVSHLNLHIEFHYINPWCTLWAAKRCSKGNDILKIDRIRRSERTSALSPLVGLLHMNIWIH